MWKKLFCSCTFPISLSLSRLTREKEKLTNSEKDLYRLTAEHIQQAWSSKMERDTIPENIYNNLVFSSCALSQIWELTIHRSTIDFRISTCDSSSLIVSFGSNLLLSCTWLQFCSRLLSREDHSHHQFSQLVCRILSLEESDSIKAGCEPALSYHSFFKLVLDYTKALLSLHS